MKNAGLRIQFYSGDADTVVPIDGSIYWIKQLNKQHNYTTVSLPQEWTVGEKNSNKTHNAGYWTQYESLRFIEVKKAGHQVPEFKPAAAHKLFRTFIHNKALSSTTLKTLIFKNAARPHKRSRIEHSYLG